jgi:hypothetical protein
MKSGSYLTSSSNSRIRVFLAWLRRARAAAMGDDCLEQTRGESREEIEAHYLRLGHTVKDITTYDEEFEFCSHLYKAGVAEPLTWAKTLFKLLSQKTKCPEKRQDLWRQFQYEMRHSPKLATCEKLISRIGWNLQNNDVKQEAGQEGQEEVQV